MGKNVHTIMGRHAGYVCWSSAKVFPSRITNHWYRAILMAGVSAEFLDCFLGCWRRSSCSALSGGLWYKYNTGPSNRTSSMMFATVTGHHLWRMTLSLMHAAREKPKRSLLWHLDQTDITLPRAKLLTNREPGANASHRGSRIGICCIIILGPWYIYRIDGDLVQTRPL